MTDATQRYFDPKGSINVITGGCNGIGKAIALLLASLGAQKVILVDLPSQLHKASEIIQQMPSNVGRAIGADCSKEMDLRKVIIQVQFEEGDIDAFFCNAGIPSNGGVEVTNDEWERIWNINVMQSVFVARHLMPSFVERQKGALVITASSAGLLTLPGALPYSVTKHAAVAVAEWLAMTYASPKPKNDDEAVVANSGIQVLCICPQGVRTAMIGDTDGGPTATDGILEPKEVAKSTIQGMKNGQFMIYPHVKTAKYFANKARDYDRWLEAMKQMHSVFGEALRVAPNMSAARL